MSSIAIVISAKVISAHTRRASSAKTSHVRSAEPAHVAAAEPATHVTSAEPTTHGSSAETSATAAVSSATSAAATSAAAAAATTAACLGTRRKQRPGQQGSCQYHHRFSSSHAIFLSTVELLSIIESDHRTSRSRTDMVARLRNANGKFRRQ